MIISKYQKQKLISKYIIHEYNRQVKVVIFAPESMLRRLKHGLTTLKLCKKKIKLGGVF